MLIALSWKNIWRNKTRSIILLLAVSFGLFAGIFSIGVMNGVVEERIKSAVKTEVSHIQIHNKDYNENMEIGYTINNADSIMKNIENKTEVLSVVKRLKISGMLSSSHAAGGVIIYGIDPQKEKLQTDIYTKIIDGSYFESNKKNQIVISEKIASKIKAKINSKLVLTFQNNDEYISGGSFKVVGIYKTINSKFDESSIFVKSSELFKLTSLDLNSAHEIAVLLKSASTENLIAEKIKKEFSNLSVQLWRELSPELGILTSMTDQMLFIFMLIIMLALAFGMVNTMLMAVMERTKEIGMLMAVGMKNSKIFIMIAFESVQLSALGGVVGVIFSRIAIEYFSQNGIDMTIFAKGLSAFGYNPVIFPIVEMNHYIYTAVMVIITSLLASLYPALKALKLNPCEVLRS